MPDAVNSTAGDVSRFLDEEEKKEKKLMIPERITKKKGQGMENVN